VSFSFMDVTPKQKGTGFQPCPLLLANQECPH
jgi:hypothetical protein